MKITTYDDESALAKALEMKSPIGTEGAQDRAQANALAEGLELTSDERLCAMLEAMRMGVPEIERATGWPSGWIFGVRMKRDYRVMVQRCLHLRAAQEVEGAESIKELFNAQVRPSARTLIEVRDNPFSKAMVRVKAAIEFLDRAPDAPKATKQVDERSIRLVLPVQELRNMQQALLEEGTPADLEVYELLEGAQSDNGDDGAVKVIEIP